VSPRTICLPVLLFVALASRVSAEELADRAAGMLEDAAPLVEKALGVEFRTPPRVQVLTPDAALAAFTEDLRPEVERRYPQATAGQRRTLLRGLARGSVQSAVARYSVTLKSLVVVPGRVEAQAAAQGLTGEAAAEFLLAAVAHEAVHALDDQRFDLAKLYRSAKDREALRAVAMVIEGRAVHFGAVVAKELGVRPEIRGILPGGKNPRGRRAWTFRLTYAQGARFTAALLARGGRELADRAMREPPKLTSYLFHPEHWPEQVPDLRPEGVLMKAFLNADPEPLSELELMARYADLDGPEAAAKLIAGLTGGAQWLWKGTNLTALAFDSEEAAERYLARSLREVPAARKGTLLIRAAGPAAEEAMVHLRKALASFRD
jgi:hypothetical protein